MRLLLSTLVCMLCSCISNPSVTVIDRNGATIRLSTGMNLMAEVDEQVSEVEGNGFHLRHMVKKQDATRVPIAGIQGLVSHGLAKLTAHSEDLKTTTDGKVQLGAQEVQKNADLLKAQGEATSKALDKFPADVAPPLGTIKTPGS